MCILPTLWQPGLSQACLPSADTVIMKRRNAIFNQWISSLSLIAPYRPCNKK